jgi:hypothetical protein
MNTAQRNGARGANEHRALYAVAAPSVPQVEFSRPSEYLEPLRWLVHFFGNPRAPSATAGITAVQGDLVLLGPRDPNAWVLDITRSGSCDAMTSYREFEGLVAALHARGMISVSA